MKVTTSKYINARLEAPSLNVAKPFYRAPGFTLEIDQVVIGDEIDGNSVWYHCLADNCYYWSGGITEVEFEMGLTINTLSEERQHILLAEAKQYFLFKYQNISEFTGLAIDHKIIGGKEIDKIGLTFYLLNKTIDAINAIPKFLKFKGFTIYTDIIESENALFQSAFPKKLTDSISKVDDLVDFGTCGIRVTGTTDENKGVYVLTNYHVVASDFIKSSQYIFSAIDDGIIDCVMPSWSVEKDKKNVIGYIYSGEFNALYDIALIQVSNPESISNTTLQNVELTKEQDIFKDNKAYTHKGKPVIIHGNISKKTPSVIISTNISRKFEMFKKTFQKDNLIQLRKASTFGDSGSAVTMNGEVIGILIGSDSNFSYAIPIQRIITHFKIKLF